MAVSITSSVGIRATRRRTFAARLGVPATVSAIVILGILILALFGPQIAPHPETVGALANRLLPPGTPGYPLGTDGQGRDILSRLIFGARPALYAGVGPVVIAAVVGIPLGILAGLAPRRVGSVIMRFLDVIYAFPAVLLAIAVSAALGPGLSNAVIALGVVLTPSVVRLTEAEVARMRNAEYMEAARTSGASPPRIALRQVMPVIAPPLIVYLTAAVGLSLVYAAGLSFLGLGVAPPTAEWGVMVNELQKYLFTVPSLLLAPALAILIASVAFNVLGDGLQKVLNVKMAEGAL